MDQQPKMEFATARSGRIAYQRFGRGSEPIVAVPPSAQNIEAGWDQPDIRRMLERFGMFSDFVHFDKLGTGASDRGRLVGGIDERVDDLRAVMDSAGIESAHLFAQSEGGPWTLLFAATYPHRVISVILLGSTAQMRADDTDPDELRARHESFAASWGTPDSRVVDYFAPSKSSDAEYRSWHERYERLSASSDSILDLLRMNVDVDVREVLPTLEVPVLVLHRKNDAVIPVAWGQEVADLVPNGRMVLLDGVDHFGYVGDVDPWMDEIERFVTGTVSHRPAAAAEAPVRVRTMGRFAVLVGGVEIPTSEWGSRRARTLLKRLLVAKGWPVSREEMIELLWPGETDMGKLGARLSVQLSAVRRVLRGGVVADRSTIALDLNQVAVDAVEFLAANEPSEIVELYAGPFLPTEVDQWATVLREELRTRFTQAAHQLMAAAADRAEHDTVVELGHRLIDADAYDEAAYGAVAASLSALGDAAAADRVQERRAQAMTDLLRKDS